MPLFAIPFPAIDPVAISLGPIAIRWYALAYIVGLLIGWRYCLALAERPPHLVGRQDVDDFLVWATLGVVLGGRIGYVLFYKPGYYAFHPLEALYVWHGGMSFHGGALGVTTAILLFTRARKISVFAFSDIIAEATPDRSVLWPDRQFHQWRAVWPADPGFLGDDVPERRRDTPSSEPALRSLLRGYPALSAALRRRAPRREAAPRDRHRIVLGRVRGRPHVG